MRFPPKLSTACIYGSYLPYYREEYAQGKKVSAFWNIAKFRGVVGYVSLMMPMSAEWRSVFRIKTMERRANHYANRLAHSHLPVLSFHPPLMARGSRGSKRKVWDFHIIPTRTHDSSLYAIVIKCVRSNYVLKIAS